MEGKEEEEEEEEKSNFQKHRVKLVLKNPLPANSKINKLPKFSEQYNIYILVN